MWFADRLVNLVTGLGTTKDKAIAAAYAVEEMTAQQIMAAYRSDWIARKIVDIPAFDMIREGRNWQADDATIEKLEAEEARLQLWPKLAKALKLARLFGGSALIIGLGDTNPDQAAEPKSVGEGKLSFIHVLSRYEITEGEIDRDPASPGWGEPKSYSVAMQSGTQVTLHPSRVIPFVGSEQLDPFVSTCWSDSVLQVLDEAVKNASLTASGIAHLIQEAKIDVYQIPGFMAGVGDPAYREKILQRVRLANTAKSTVNGLLMDADEQYTQKQISFAQLPEVMRLYLQIAAGAADIPATRLLGQSPDGMNATGEGDLRNYYDRLAADQEITLRPRLAKLDEFLIRSALGTRPPEVHFEFAPLWQLSETEKATIFKTKADGARAIAGSGGTSMPLMPIEALSDALVNTFVEDGSLPGLEAAIEEYGKLADQEDDEAETEAAATPPTAVKPEPVTDAAPRTLYVQRKLTNGADLIAWAKGQGFATTLEAAQMHVTITYSRTPVDWMRMGENWSGDGKGNLTVQAGGPRIVEALGDKGAVVLLFKSADLQWRHESMIENGASFDFPEYQPHVTFTYAPGDVDLTKVEPYRGELNFGPEIFEELDEDWSSRVIEA